MLPHLGERRAAACGRGGAPRLAAAWRAQAPVVKHYRYFSGNYHFSDSQPEWYGIQKSGMVFLTLIPQPPGVRLIRRGRRLIWQSPPPKWQIVKIRGENRAKTAKISSACCSRWKPTSPMIYFMPATGRPIKLCLDTPWISGFLVLQAKWYLYHQKVVNTTF